MTEREGLSKASDHKVTKTSYAEDTTELEKLSHLRLLLCIILQLQAKMPRVECAKTGWAWIQSPLACQGWIQYTSNREQ